MLGMHSLRVVAVFLFAAAVAVSVYAAQAQDAVAKGAAILADARKALGGEDKLAVVKALQARGTVRRAAGEINLEGDLDLSIELPNKYLRKESIILGGNGQGLDRVEGLNGAEAWEEIKFGGGVNFGDGGDFGGGGDFRGGGNRGGRAGGQPGTPQADGRGGQDPEAAKQQMLVARQTEVARVLLAMLLTSEVPPRWIGTAVTPQATAEVLEIRTADGTPTRIMIDSKTNMPLMLQWTGIAQDPLAALAGRAGFGRRGGRGGRGGFQGGGRGGFPGGGQQARGGAQPDAGIVRADALAQPTALQMFLSDYKTVNGIKLPHLMVRGAGDQVTEEWIVKNYRINPNFNPETFSK
jgi:hypothetical protein